MGISIAFSKSVKNTLHLIGAASFITAYITADSESFRLVHVYVDMASGSFFCCVCAGAQLWVELVRSAPYGEGQAWSREFKQT